MNMPGTRVANVLCYYIFKTITMSPMFQFQLFSSCFLLLPCWVNQQQAPYQQQGHSCSIKFIIRSTRTVVLKRWFCNFHNNGHKLFLQFLPLSHRPENICAGREWLSCWVARRKVATHQWVQPGQRHIDSSPQKPCWKAWVSKDEHRFGNQDQPSKGLGLNNSAEKLRKKFDSRHSCHIQHH